MSWTKAVIGANYGDEGKGRVVDWLCRDNAEAWIPADHRLVVRFNGGGQAGHTVVSKEGTHVFQHIGSGALAGAPTHLSRFFIVNPIIFANEMSALLKILSHPPRVSCDPSCLVTTPFEMAMNQSREELRGEGRHGSCGAGVGETIDIAENDNDYLRVKDIVDADKAQDYTRVHEILKRREIRLIAFRERNGLPPLDTNTMNFEFMSACEIFLLHVVTMKDQRRLGSHGLVIFEGAQGLLLDQTYGEFPYVTRSNTGLRNVMQLCREADLPTPEIHYLSRCYMTRHGRGPLEHEDKSMSIPDSTNVWNKFQEGLRFGLLHVPKLVDRIYADLNRNVPLTPDVNVWLHLSHFDQISEGPYVGQYNNVKRGSPLFAARDTILDRKGWSRTPEKWNLMSWRGPSASDGTKLNIGA